MGAKYFERSKIPSFYISKVLFFSRGEVKLCLLCRVHRLKTSPPFQSNSPNHTYQIPTKHMQKSMQTTNTKSTTNNYTIFITTNHPSFQKCYMYFSPLVKPNKAEVRARFLHIDTWISQSCCMEYSKLLHGFVKIDTCISSPLSNQTKPKFHQDFSIYNDRRVCVM